MNTRLLALLAALSSPVWAQTPAASPVAATEPTAEAAAAPEPATPRVAEPNVRLTVIEERGTRIEELRVRGQLTRISVKPAGGTGGGYEILPQAELRDDADGRAGSRSAVGQRVWRVLAF